MSGLTVYRSNRLEVLVELLAWLAPQHLPLDPMTPLRVVVANAGMARWLEHRLAERWGVCAQLELPFPARALDDLTRAVAGLEPTPEDADPWSPEVLAWAVIEALPGLLEGADPIYDPLRAYLEPGDIVTARAYSLARQVADVFDRYATYRPALARAWSTGERLDPLPPGLAWQPPLWAELTRRVGGAHAAQRARLLHEAIRHARTFDPAQPLRIFGLSNMQPAWLDLVATLAQRMPIELYLLCPSDTYWADLHRRRDRFTALAGVERAELGEALRLDDAEPGNPLLSAFGRVMRDFQIALEGLPDVAFEDRQDVFISMGGDGFPDPATGVGIKALERLQSDVLHARLSRQAPLAPDDDSVQLHACHGPIRQVEVLRDVLLGLFVDHPTLEPRHVVVMCPTIQDYAPLISAVFDQGPRHRDDDAPPPIPYAIADLSLRRSNPVADALLRLLALANERLTAPTLLEVLAAEPVRRRFEIAPEQLSTVRRWVVDSGMRWGTDAADREDAGQPRDVLNTIQFGLDRLLLGACVADTGADTLGGVRPYGALAPGDLPLLGRFTDFVTRTAGLRDALRTPRPLAEWVTFLRGEEGVLATFTATSQEGAWLTAKVDDELEQLARAASAVEQRRPIDVAALHAALTGRFDVAGADAAPRETGGVTFSSLEPMRGLPHRVVCLLGMDEGAFPRKNARRAFDLVSRTPRLGDRDRSDDDRGALLEAVLAARRHLVVLYTGHDARTNERCAPAVPISELRDAIDATFAPHGKAKPSEVLTRTHPLQAFSPRNFGASGEPTSFDPQLASAASAARSADREARPFFSAGDELPPAPEEASERVTDLEALARFLKNPHRALLKRRFNLYEVEAEADAVPEREPFEIERGLPLWKLHRALLEGRLAGQPTEVVESRLRSAGALPLGAGAEVALEAPRALVGLLVDELLTLPPADSDITVQHQVGEHLVVGYVGGLRGPADAVCRFGKDTTSRAWSWVLAPWVRLLGRQLAEPRADACVVVLHPDDDRRPKNIRWRTFATDADPTEHLSALLALRDEARDQPVPLIPNGSFLFAYKLKKALADVSLEEQAIADALADLPTKDREGAVKALRSAWRPYQGRGDANDPCVARLFGDRNPAFLEDGETICPAFARAALTLWRPIVTARKAPRKRPVFGGAA